MDIWGQGCKEESTAKEHEGSFGGNGDILFHDVVMVLLVSTIDKTPTCTLQMKKCIAYKSLLNKADKENNLLREWEKEKSHINII